MSNIRGLLRSIPVAALVAAAALSACSSGPPKPAQINGKIVASAQLNPSVSKRPSPLLVRIYELKSAAVFNDAAFMSLYQKDQTELGADFIAKDEIVLAPGETKPYTKVLSPDTRFVGVVAAYRDIEHARWRALVPIKTGQQHALTITAGELAIDVKVAP